MLSFKFGSKALFKAVLLHQQRSSRIDNIVILTKHHSPSHVFGDKRMIVKYMQLCALFSPFTLLCEGKRYEVVPEIKRNVRSFILI